MITLHAANDQEVVSRTLVDAELGLGGRRLVVVSGIGLVHWKVDTTEVAHQDLRVRLGISARDLEQATPYVGLASIGADDTSFTFAVDQAAVTLVDGELVLDARLGASGEKAWVNRVSYTVVATLVRAAYQIVGTISWPRHLLPGVAADVSAVGAQLRVTASTVARGDGFGPLRLTPVAAGAVVAVDDRSPGDVVATYRIDGPPLSTDLAVEVQVGPGFRPDSGAAAVVAGRVSGAPTVRLSGQQPTARVDFRLASSPVVR